MPLSCSSQHEKEATTGIEDRRIPPIEQQRSLRYSYPFSALSWPSPRIYKLSSLLYNTNPTMDNSILSNGTSGTFRKAVEHLPFRDCRYQRSVLARDVWSMVMRLRQAINEYTPPCLPDNSALVPFNKTWEPCISPLSNLYIPAS